MKKLKTEGAAANAYGANPDELGGSRYPVPLISGRLDLSKLAIDDDHHWAAKLAEEVVQAFPEAQVYTCAAGISPSGIVHFGNLRDVMTSLAVAKGLNALGKKTRLLFSWDDYDRFRKVPAGLPNSFREFIGLPLTEVPDPDGLYESYARKYEVPFEDSIAQLGIEMEWRYQAKEYQSGRYLDGIITALRARTVIADVLLGHMSEKGMNEKKIEPSEFRKTYFPINVYSEFTGRDNTQVLDYDGGSKIAYRCNDTGEISLIDLREQPRAKLAWKIDWPMRWGAEGVCFEPGGRDHASPGGSFDSSGLIAQLVYGRRPPAFVGYDFIGIRGVPGKMSGSKGDALTPRELLEVFEPALLKWLYTRRSPDQSFTIAFDTDVYRTYDEFDRDVIQLSKNNICQAKATALRIADADTSGIARNRLSFRQITGLGQIVQWNQDKLIELAHALGTSDDVDKLMTRSSCSRRWLEHYQPQERIQLLVEPNINYAAALTAEARVLIQRLLSKLETLDLTMPDLEELVYGIPKDTSLSQQENAPRQRAFFKDVYNLLLGGDTGPRLATFLWAADREQVRNLLRIV